MVDFDWHEKKGADGAPLLKTLRVLLTGHLPHVLPSIRYAVSDMFDQLHESHPIVNGAKKSCFGKFLT